MYRLKNNKLTQLSRHASALVYNIIFIHSYQLRLLHYWEIRGKHSRHTMRPFSENFLVSVILSSSYHRSRNNNRYDKKNNIQFHIISSGSGD